MSRLQLALNVSDLDASVDFYSKLFASSPAKRRPGYANFALEEPPLKLVLIENPDAHGSGLSGRLNHLGIEVETSEEVRNSANRLATEGLKPSEENGTTCCYALQDKAWVHDPDGAPWEVYTAIADAPGKTDLGCVINDCCASSASVAVGSSRDCC